MKSYASAGMAVVLMGFIPLYGWFASKVDRARLIFGFTLFFILNLELFWLGAKLRVPYLSVAFFIWVGIFNNAIIAQLWSYGNDIYRQEMGERLFHVIAIRATPVLLQALVVSRIVKYPGLPGVLLTLPVLALGSYGMVASFASFTLVWFAKIAKNATDYSVMNTARQMIWLPTTREEKYKAKQAADTFIVRTGDVMSAGLMWLGTRVLELGQRGLAAANVLICLLWLAVGLLLLRENGSLSVRRATEGGLGPS